MICKKCGKQIADNASFCSYCGASYSNLPANAPPPNTNYVAVNNVSSPVYVTNVSDKSKFIALILCCLGFIGLAGIHRIYVGKIISGILYFITFGFIGIGTIIDLVQLLLGQFSDNVGYPLRKS